MSTVLIVVIVVVVLALVAAAVVGPRKAADMRRERAKKELDARRTRAVGQARAEAALHHQEASKAEETLLDARETARRERAEARAAEERAAAVEQGMSDRDLVDERERKRFAGVLDFGDDAFRDDDEPRRERVTARDGDDDAPARQEREAAPDAPDDEVAATAQPAAAAADTPAPDDAPARGAVVGGPAPPAAPGGATDEVGASRVEPDADGHSDDYRALLDRARAAMQDEAPAGGAAAAERSSSS